MNITKLQASSYEIDFMFLGEQNFLKEVRFIGMELAQNIIDVLRFYMMKLATFKFKIIVGISNRRHNKTHHAVSL